MGNPDDAQQKLQNRSNSQKTALPNPAVRNLQMGGGAITAPLGQQQVVHIKDPPTRNPFSHLSTSTTTSPLLSPLHSGLEQKPVWHLYQSHVGWQPRAGVGFSASAGSGKYTSQSLHLLVPSTNLTPPTHTQVSPSRAPPLYPWALRANSKRS